jgi:acetyl esterase/lipase
MKNAHRWSGNGKKVAVVGESAGGNMAAAVSIMAQSEGKQMPVHQVLIYPVANTVMDTPSYMENKDAKPLSAEAMKWFFDKTLATPNDASDPKIALLQAESLKGLPPTTIITAEIDPLRSEGMALAEKLRKEGVAVTYKNYEGVTHEFFGTGLVVDKARDAVALVAKELKPSFNNSRPDTNRGDNRAAGFDEQE